MLNTCKYILQLNYLPPVVFKINFANIGLKRRQPYLATTVLELAKVIKRKNGTWYVSSSLFISCLFSADGAAPFHIQRLPAEPPRQHCVPLSTHARGPTHAPARVRKSCVSAAILQLGTNNYSRCSYLHTMNAVSAARRADARYAERSVPSGSPAKLYGLKCQSVLTMRITAALTYLGLTVFRLQSAQTR